jgi:hypothetical protein
MVTGVDRFRAHFVDHEHQYVLIGGAACELIMDDAGLDFRATKDLDIVLIVEALDPAFSAFMAFVKAEAMKSSSAVKARGLVSLRKTRNRRVSCDAGAVFQRPGWFDWLPAAISHRSP